MTSENPRKAYNFFKGFGKSVLIAFIVGLAGGVFVGVIIYPLMKSLLSGFSLFPIVNYLLFFLFFFSPLVVFGIINQYWLLRKTQNYYEKWGMGIGFLAGIITFMTSLLVNSVFLGFCFLC